MNPETGKLNNQPEAASSTPTMASQSAANSAQYTMAPVSQPVQNTQSTPANGPLLDQTITEVNKIIKQTAQIPYQQALAIEKLKVEYIRKQFGRSIKAPEQ